MTHREPYLDKQARVAREQLTFLALVRKVEDFEKHTQRVLFQLGLIAVPVSTNGARWIKRLLQFYRRKLLGTHAHQFTRGALVVRLNNLNSVQKAGEGQSDCPASISVSPAAQARGCLADALARKTGSWCPDYRL